MRTVKDILQTKGDDVKTIDKNGSVLAAISEMDTHHIGSLVVVDDGKLVGVLTERDYTCKVTVKGKQAKNTLVSEIMSSNIVVVSRETSINECMALMTEKRIRHLPVIEEDKIIGMVSIGDVVKEIIDEQQVVIDQLEQYIHN